MIKAIETRYAGCRFRSRLEARWAVFFDHLKIEWRYEPQGFQLPSGSYLPDFHLPEFLTHESTLVGTWVEIKGRAVDQRETDLLFDLKRETGQAVFVLEGDVPQRATCIHQGLPTLMASRPLSMTEGRRYMDGNCFIHDRNLEDALTAARSARFEHGESPTRVR